MQRAISGTFATAATVPGGYDNLDFAFVLHGAGGGGSFSEAPNAVLVWSGRGIGKGERSKRIEFWRNHVVRIGGDWASH